MSIPKDLRYSKEHEWVKVEGENARIDITFLPHPYFPPLLQLRSAF